MADAFWNFTEPITFELTSTTSVDFEVSQVVTGSVVFDGVLEPIPERELLVKPEGQRTWMWWKLFTTQVLKLDDIVKDQKNRQFKVMRKADWGQNGWHYEYQIAQEPDTTT